MTSIKTSSTTPGQRSPDMGGFFQLLYHGSFGAGYRSVSGTKTGNWTLEEIGSYSNKKRAAESISNRIIWKKRVLQWRKSKASLHKCSCTTTTTTDGKLGFFSMYQTVLLQLFIAVWVSGQALTSDFGCPKNQVSHGIPKGIPAFTKVWPNKPAAHGVKLWPLGCLCFFLAHLFFLQQISNRFWKQTLYRNLLIFPPSSCTGNWCIFQSCLSSSCCGSSTNLESRRSCNSCDGSFGSGCPSLIILPWNLLTWNLKMMVSKRNFLF